MTSILRLSRPEVFKGLTQNIVSEGNIVRLNLSKLRPLVKLRPLMLGLSWIKPYSLRIFWLRSLRHRLSKLRHHRLVLSGSEGKGEIIYSSSSLKTH